MPGRRQILQALGRALEGEIDGWSDETVGGDETFVDAALAVLPRDLPGYAVRTEALLRPVRACLGGRATAPDLWAWADTLSRLIENHRFSYPDASEDVICDALHAIATLCHPSVLPDEERTHQRLGYVVRCLLGEERFQARRVRPYIFRGVETLHLADKRAAEADDYEPRQWTDVVALDRCFIPGADIYESYTWIVAFTVSTRRLFLDEWADGRRTEGIPDAARDVLVPVDGALDLVRALEQSAPNFEFSRHRPSYVHSSQGVAEIVLEARRIGPKEVAYATKLFALANRVSSCFLDGKRVATLVVESGLPLVER